MDPDEMLFANTWTKSSSSGSDAVKSLFPDNQSFTNFSSRQQKWEDSSFLDCRARIEQQFSDFGCPSENLSLVACDANKRMKDQGHEDNRMLDTPESNNIREWDPKGMLNNLSFMEQKIHQLRDLVHLIVGRRGQAVRQSNELLVQQQQLLTADLTSIIVQLISTAGSLLPSVKHTISSVSPPITELGQFGGSVIPSGTTGFGNGGKVVQSNVKKVEDESNEMDLTGNTGLEQNYAVEEHESKDEDDADEGENLPPGSYEILQLEKEEILAPHTHFCTICGKGFKRDANLRMHMRGHGDEYKTAAALAKPNKESTSDTTLIKRYSCPSVGCKRNKDHKKFQPLKTILCVKNHYKRTHCDKRYTCSRCHTKKFSVIADLKTHEKHCGRDKWLCSCGTTFSRKDKLFGHIALFQGHTPAIPLDESKGPAGPSDGGQSSELVNKVEQIDFNVQSNVPSGTGFQNAIDSKGSVDDPASYFSPLNFDPSNLSGFHEFPRPPFEDTESSFSFLLSGSSEYAQKRGGYPGSSNLQ